MSRLDAPTRWLLIVTVAVVASFVAASGYVQSSAHVIDGQATSIAEIGAPGIYHLTVARGDVRAVNQQLRYSLRDDAPWSPSRAHTLEQALERLRVDLALADALPPSGSRHDRLDQGLRQPLPEGSPERTLREDIRVALGELDAVEEVLGSLEDGKRSEARRAMDSLYRPNGPMARLDDAIEGLVELRAETTRRLGERIAAERARSERVAALLDCVAVGLAILLAVLAVRAARSHARLVDERQRATEERARELELFAGRVAHDLKNPLAAIMFRSSALAQRSGSTPLSDGELRTALGKIEQAGGAMSDIVDGLLEFARSGGRSRPDERTSVEQVVERVLAAHRDDAERRNARLALAGPLPDVEVACSTGALTSALSNLVSNALKYLSPPPAERSVSIAATVESGLVRLRVDDTGPGVPKGMEEAIFEAYVRGPEVRERGLGLGLATVKRIVESHGGAVAVSRRPEGGSSFVITLPRARIPLTAASRSTT